jgi:hypothetical protein
MLMPPNPQTFSSQNHSCAPKSVVLNAAPATKIFNQTCQRKKQLYFPLVRIHCKEKVKSALNYGLKKISWHFYALHYKVSTKRMYFAEYL